MNKPDKNAKRGSNLSSHYTHHKQDLISASNQHLTDCNDKISYKFKLCSSGKKASFLALIDEQNPDIIYGCESHLGESYRTAEIFPNGYLILILHLWLFRFSLTHNPSAPSTQSFLKTVASQDSFT